MTKQKLEQILTTHEWIEVDKYYEFDEYDRPDSYDYFRLLEHHKKETEFLIAKVRELAQKVYDLEQESGEGHE